MRNARVCGFFAPSVLFVGASLAACDGSSDGGASSGNFESESGAFEAGSNEEGSVPDTSILTDGAKVDGAMGTGVSVTVGATASPKANVRVIFQDATGAILGEALTDAAGMAVSTALPSMVTVLYAPPAQAGTAVTFLGVNDGDALHVVPSIAADPANPDIGSISVPYTANSITKGALNYAYVNNLGCMNVGNSPINVPMTANCAHTGNTVFFEANSAGSPTLGFALAKNVTSPTAGNTVTIPALTITAAGTRKQAGTNIPSGGTAVGNAWEIAGQDMHILSSSADDISQPAGLTVYVPLDSIDAFQTEIYSANDLADGTSQTGILHRELPTTTATGAFTSVDFNTALPMITAVSATATARPDVTITTSATTAAAAGYAQISWGTASTWTFVMPGNTTAFKVPALPADATTFTPNGTVVVQTVGYADGALLPSYAAFKALPIPTEALPALMDDQQPLPATGAIKISTYLRNPGGE